MMLKKITNLIEYFQYLENPIEALKFKFGLKEECTIKIKNTSLKIKLKNITALNKLMNKLPTIINERYEEFIEYIKDIDGDKEVITIDNINYINIYNKNFMNNNPNNYSICIEEYFSDDQWDMVNFSNRNVIDIGANVGDTALYFAKKNAKVIAFEPVKHLYELGIKNISLNPNLKNNIQFINKAVGGKNGKISITNSSTKGYINEQDTYKIDVITVKEIINNYQFPADILKMDCEGCEFEIILNEDLSMFNDIIFEHHSILTGKDYNLLIKELEKQGFNINTYAVAASKLNFEDIGIIHAFK